MKKRFLLASLCVALSATSVLADVVNTSTAKNLFAQDNTSIQKIAKPDSGRPQKAEFGNPGHVPKTITKEQAKRFFEARKAQERAALYDALAFTAEQKAKAEALDVKTKAELRPFIKKWHQETKKLHDLKSKNASIFAIWKQQFAVNSAKSEVKNKFMASKKSFEAILTNEQKAKFKKIDAQKRKQMEEFRKSHKPGGKGPGLKPQGHGPGFMGPPPNAGHGPGEGFPPPPPPENKK